MTRIKKIEQLIANGEDIKFHYKQYSFQRRLIIDNVENISYNNNSEDQKLANEHIDLLYWEWTNKIGG